MRKSDQLLGINSLALTVRWAFLLAISLWLAMSGGYTWPVVLTLALMGLATTGFTVWAGTGWQMGAYRLVSLMTDGGFALVIYTLTGQLDGSLAWTGALPVIVGSLYYGWLGGLLAGLVMLAAQGLITWQTLPLLDMALSLVLALLLYLAAGVGTVFLARWLGRPVRATPGIGFGAGGRVDPAAGRRRTIYELLSAISATLTYQKIFETTLDVCMEALDALGIPTEKLIGVVLLFSESKQPELYVASARRLIPSDMKVTLPGASGALAEAIEGGVSIVVRDVRIDPEISRFLALQKCRSAYCYPLRSGLDVYGALLFAHVDIEYFTSDCREILDIVGHQSAIALQNARLYRDLGQEKERMMEIQDEARKKMARDLHDGPTQSIAAIAMRVNFARRLMERDTKAAGEELFKIEELARKTTKEIRHMLFTLRPLVLESEGLVAALQSMADKMKDTYSQNVIVQADPAIVESIESGKQAVVFYLAEEAVNNARKHARAAHIWVRLKKLREGLCLLEIEDDGAGFDVAAVDSAYEKRGSLGMINMKERTELVNGLLRIDSKLGRGTRIRVLIPLTNEEAERLQRGQ